MKNESSNPNIEWKKPGFDNKERITLKVNLREAVVYDATRKNGAPKTFTPSISENLPNGLKKIRKKIRRDSYDEDDEEEESFQIAPSELALNEANSLMNALNDEEKKILQQQQNLETMKLQQNAGKMEAVSIAGTIAQQAGLKGLDKDIVNRNIQSVATPEELAQQTLKDILQEKEHIKGGKITDGKQIQTLRGAKRVKEMGGNEALQGMNLSDLQKAGEQNADEKKIAKLILEKSGQKAKRRKINRSSENKMKSKSRASVRRNLSLKNLNDR